jgi:phosphatidate cytidylyltransferase
MLQRIISGVVLGAGLIAAILWLPALASTAVLSVLLLLAAWEWSGFLGRDRLASRAGFMVATCLVCALLWRRAAGVDALRTVLWGAGLFWVAAAVWVWGFPRAVNRPLVWLAGLIALPLAWLALARMRMDWHLGQYWVLYALCIVWAADSGAYFAGRLWGRRKLAPRVSPGKTWAGLWGGLATAALLAVVAAPWLTRGRAALVVLTLLVALGSVVGDLTESLFKRYAGLKDSGRLIPGHGGVLDRFDSLLAAAPLLMLGAGYLGKVPW